jgi:hypothetical protein
LVVADLDLRNSQLMEQPEGLTVGGKILGEAIRPGAWRCEKRPAAWQSRRLSLTATLTDLGIDQQLCHLDQLAS